MKTSAAHPCCDIDVEGEVEERQNSDTLATRIKVVNPGDGHARVSIRAAQIRPRHA